MSCSKLRRPAPMFACAECRRYDTSSWGTSPRAWMRATSAPRLRRLTRCRGTRPVSLSQSSSRSMRMGPRTALTLSCRLPSPRLPRSRRARSRRPLPTSPCWRGRPPASRKWMMMRTNTSERITMAEQRWRPCMRTLAAPASARVPMSRSRKRRPPGRRFSSNPSLARVPPCRPGARRGRPSSTPPTRAPRFPRAWASRASPAAAQRLRLRLPRPPPRPTPQPSPSLPQP
mmetsp:Transcript_11936/g.30592  ORF Transcript_11936/g.30592 Transcript_11936/m.30592 type:complete len:230 (-) Transcript_11936:1109-1798(-)